MMTRRKRGQEELALLLREAFSWGRNLLSIAFVSDLIKIICMKLHKKWTVLKNTESFCRQLKIGL